MADPTPERLAEYLRGEVGDELRSVVHYRFDGEEQLDYDLVHAREDVMSAYSDADVEQVVQMLGLESVEKQFHEELYVHGEMDAVVRRFDEAIEMNFLLGRGEGIAVSLDPAVFVAHNTFLGRCLERAGIE